MNHSLFLTDGHFQLQHSPKCDLLIQLGSHSVSYAIIDKEQDQLKVLFNKPLAATEQALSNTELISQLQLNHEYLRQSFRRVKISIETSKFTFIPDDLYQEDDRSQYARFLAVTLPGDVQVNAVSGFGLQNVAATDSDLRKMLNEQFEQPAIYSQVEPMLQGISRIYKNDGPSQLFLNFSEGKFEAALLQDGGLTFYNIYSIPAADDFNYYLLNLISHSGLDINQTALRLSGKISIEDEKFLRLKKYFKDPAFADSLKLVRQTSAFRLIPAHNYFSLLSLDLCE